MDSCKKFKELLSDYIEGGLDPQSKLLMEQHLKECLNCSKVITRLKTLNRTLKELPNLAVSQDFETILRTRIRVESGLARRRRERFTTFLPIQNPVFAAAALIIFLAATFVFVTQFNKRGPVYPTEAFTNLEWQGGGESKPQPSSNGHVVYFIEKQPVPYIQSNQDSNTNSDREKSSSDSTYFQVRPNRVIDGAMPVNNERVY